MQWHGPPVMVVHSAAQQLRNAVVPGGCRCQVQRCLMTCVVCNQGRVRTAPQQETQAAGVPATRLNKQRSQSSPNLCKSAVNHRHTACKVYEKR